jgi:hypothetical protein
MDATSGTGKLPLMQNAEGPALVRLFDMPIQMEKIEIADAWPCCNTDAEGEDRFWTGGFQARQVRFAALAEARHAVPGFMDDPFQHLEPGSWSCVLGSERLDGPWAGWDRLSTASREAVKSGRLGEYESVTAAVERFAEYSRAADAYKHPPLHRH